MSLPINRSERGDANYEVKSGALAELTPDELKKCLAIIEDGGAVNLNTMKRDLPRSEVLAIARLHGEIVGIGAIKPARKRYAVGIAAKSGYAFPPETLELGYVTIAPEHRGHRLSHKITGLLLSKHEGPLFATTDSPQMKKTLADAGFRQQGSEWQGERGFLSLWGRA